MPTWTVLTAPVPEDLDSPDAWALHGAARVTYAIEMATWGYPDLMYPASYLVAELSEQTYSIRRLLIAVPAGTTAPTADDVIGMAKITLPLKDNTHLMYLELYTEPGHTRHGVGSALLAAAEQIAAEHERSTVIAWTEHAGEPAADVPGVLEPPTGSGRIRPDDAGGRFSLHHGYGLEQAERYSVLQLPVEESLRARLHAEAAAKAGANYRLVSWTDRAPDEWVDQVAVLETRMSTDAPTAGLDMGETTWDADRVRTWEKEVAEGRPDQRRASGQEVAREIARFQAELPPCRNQPGAGQTQKRSQNMMRVQLVSAQQKRRKHHDQQRPEIVDQVRLHCRGQREGAEI